MMVVLLPQRAEATSFIKDKQNYTAQMAGKDAISFSLPTFDYWRLSGNVYVTDDSYIEATVDGSTKTIFRWKSEGSDWNSSSMASASSSGTFTVLREQYGSSYDNIVVKVDNWSYFMLGGDMDDSDHKTMKVRWQVPYEWQGKKIKLRANVVCDEATGKDPAMDNGKIDMIKQ